jgi:uncharacterized delta-60 repeat protein
MTIKRILAFLFCLFLLSLPVFSQKLLVDSSFAPNINGMVNFVEVLADGKILIAGNFSSVNGVTRYRIARLNADGSLDASFDANSSIFAIDIFQPQITSMKLLPDGKILVGGSFPFINGSVTTSGIRVYRLNANGTFDSTLTSVPFLGGNNNLFQIIRKVDQLPNGKILVCGKFTSPNNNPQPMIARYNNNGTYDSTFTTAINDECQDVEVLPDGKYYVSGYFTTVNASPRQSLVRFNADDSLDTSFNAAPIPNQVNERTYYSYIKLQSDGKIVAFRGYSVYKRASRLNPDGTLHMEFPGNVDYPGDAAFQPNGKVTITAEYATDNGFGLSEDFNRYNTDGTHDPSLNRFDLYGEGEGYAKGAAYAADGSLILGGDFIEVTTNNVTVNRPYLVRLTAQAIPVKPRYDFDGDGKDDIAVFRPSDRVWYLNQSANGFSSTQFGLSTDIPVAADYDGDGKADIAVFRDGAWYWLRSSDSVFAYRITGQAGDIPTPQRAANGLTNLLVFRPSAARFYTQQPFGNAQPVEFRNMTLLPTDKPVIADYDGDGRDDLAVFRDGNWFFMESSHAATKHYQFGIAGDKPAVGDFDGDLRSDFAIFRPSTGVWYIKKSNEGFYIVQWGIAEDIPVPADYDGDGKTDIAVFRPSTGIWYIIKSTGGYHIEHFGLTNDIPAQMR